VVAGPVEKNLRFVLEPPEGPRMDDARPVTLKFRPKNVARLWIFTAARFPGFLGIGRQETCFVRLHFFARFPAIAIGFSAPSRLVRHIRTIRRSSALASPHLTAPAERRLNF
jgi:hypothetical protein